MMAPQLRDHDRYEILGEHGRDVDRADLDPHWARSAAIAPWIEASLGADLHEVSVDGEGPGDTHRVRLGVKISAAARHRSDRPAGRRR